MTTSSTVEVTAEQITVAARRAKQKAEAAADAAQDGGSANLDATFYCLAKGERANHIASAFQAAGLSASPTRWGCMGRGVMIQPPGGGQAGKRYASNQALYKELRKASLPVCPYYQMD